MAPPVPAEFSENVLPVIVRLPAVEVRDAAADLRHQRVGRLLSEKVPLVMSSVPVVCHDPRRAAEMLSMTQLAAVRMVPYSVDLSCRAHVVLQMPPPIFIAHSSP